MELAYSSQCSSSPSPCSSSQSSSSCNPHSKEVHQVLYLLDRFAISDQFYHELAMINPSLPRSYQVKKARNLLTSNVKIKRLPKPHFGCYRPLRECLIATISAEVCEYRIQYGIITCIHFFTSQIDDISTVDSPVEVKIGGDGAPFSRTSSYILLSFSLPSLQKNLSSAG